MSHFSVLVIGPDVEAQLQPFHMFECDGLDDQYVQDLDVTAKLREEFTTGAAEHGMASFKQFVTEYHGLPLVEAGRRPNRKAHKFGYCQLDSQGDVVKVVQRTNPNSKWDWWTVGGRWTGFFQLKPGRTGLLGNVGVPELFMPKEDRVSLAIERLRKADTCLKQDIDFDRMRDDAAQQAATFWEEANQVIAGRPIQRWADLQVQFGTDYEKAREAFWGQLVLHDLRKSGKFVDDEDLKGLLGSKEQYVLEARCKVLCIHAVVVNSQWHQQGEMGWFGFVSDPKPGEQWERQFARLLDSQPDDTLFTIVDCHI